MSKFPPLLPSGELREVLPEIFFVTGQMSSGEGQETMHYSRNMTIVRDEGALSLINTVRLDEVGLARLDALGTVRNVVRLGFNHGRDDEFYLKRYNADFWAVPGMEFVRGEVIDRSLIAGEPGPCEGSSVFTFETANKPEAILYLDRNGGTLVSCDSLQNFSGPNEFFNELAISRMKAGGFFNPANVGPGWKMVTEPKAEDFARLKQLNFRHLLSGHGEPRVDDAYQAYSATFSELYGI